ncbi:MAG: serine hydrolase domain-containing protein [Jatrophihabitans sp.]|uniref:serine hydrolase domain-containing protein n=1 Tax=Jatrophihabitans sp. TaxID=1932789 RepID=UPI003914EB7F
MTSSGSCDAAFGPVREIFDESLAGGGDLGAAVAVYLDGRCVLDLWGGIADERTGRRWERDTRCVTFSATKAVTATAALVLAERGAVTLDARVTEWWPEFGRAGKGDTTAEHLLTHQAGLPAFDRPISVDEASDPVAMADHLAGQTPEWRPGTDHGYHALTFGWLVGELVRRHSGRTVGEFVREEFGPDLWLGVPAGSIDDLARISAGRPTKAPDLPAPKPLVDRLVAASQDPASPLQRSTANPGASFNKPALLTAGWPAAGLVATARALAEFYSGLIGGAVLGRDRLDDAVRERVRGPDRTLITESAFGLGFMRPSANMYLPPAARVTAFGHPGASGALGLGDLDCGLALAYIPNLTRPGPGDRRAYRLVEAVYAAL